MKRTIALILAAAMTVNLISCGKNDLMLDIEPQEVTVSAEKGYLGADRNSVNISYIAHKLIHADPPENFRALSVYENVSLV